MISYDDVNAGDAGANDIIGVTLAGWMNGTGTGFSPNASLDRAMMVTILYRLAGSPAVSGTMPYRSLCKGAKSFDFLGSFGHAGQQDGSGLGAGDVGLSGGQAPWPAG